ncbi:hypothetical protein VNO77_03675 [Canavalia gladiata]|uniref:Uncharacterized protein n=1 Tax=Canavalia gladiata TaxID=3824 RepID=A0AAN9MV60_CANGL
MHADNDKTDQGIRDPPKLQTSPYNFQNYKQAKLDSIIEPFAPGNPSLSLVSLVDRAILTITAQNVDLFQLVGPQPRCKISANKEMRLGEHLSLAWGICWDLLSHDSSPKWVLVGLVGRPKAYTQVHTYKFVKGGIKTGVLVGDF